MVDYGFSGILRTDHLDEPVDKTKWFVTVRLFRYKSKIGKTYIIPAGTYTDFASIPKIFRWAISRTGRHGKAVVFHDWLCKQKIVNRKLADRLLKEALESLDVKWYRTSLMYIGVRTYSIMTLKG